MRATGIGTALAVGRIGSIVGPLIGGVMVKSGLPVEQIYLIAVLPPMISTIAIVTLWRRSLRLASSQLTAALAAASSAAE
jgi:AAHS family 4-hydroxybenzoate transporter-like MFS transporter